MAVDVCLCGWRVGVLSQFAQHGASIPHCGWDISSEDALCGRVVAVRGRRGVEGHVFRSRLRGNEWLLALRHCNMS